MKATKLFAAPISVRTLLAAAILISGTANAERYLVVMKNRDTFAQMHAQLMLQENMNLASIQLKGTQGMTQPFAAASDVEVEASLENLNMIVVDSEDEAQMEALNKSGAVAIVEKEIMHPAPKPVAGYHLTQPWDYQVSTVQLAGAAVGPQTPWGIQSVKAPQAWAAGAEGAGVNVLILDTGIDRDHTAIKNQFAEGKDFVGDQRGSVTYDYADTEGHGTHVSGTVLAEPLAGGFVGVAPKAKLFMGRVCGEDGCSNISVAMGINWGISKKVDVISMSLGGPIGTPSERRAVDMADKAGISVVAASGNSGADPKFRGKVSFPAAFPPVIAVGAIDSKNQKASFSQWGPELTIVAPGVAVVSSVPVGSGRESKVTVNGQAVKSTSFSGSPEIRNALSNTLVAAGIGDVDDFKSANVTGKFALIQRGKIKFSEKAKNAIAAGAAGVVIYNNEPGLIQGALTEDGSILSVPVVMIEQTIGESMKTELAAGKSVTASIQTIPTDYAAFDGTSMATPHVAGVVALIKSANKALTPAQVKNIVKTTAQPLGPNDENQFGSGLINAESAVQMAKTIH